MDEPMRPLPLPEPDLAQRPAANLNESIRKARIEQAERSDVVAELRGAELARLEMLKDALQPVLAQVPDDVDMFDVGIMPGVRPRLFIDMIGFVEMGRDRRTYRFLQDRRHGRVTLLESERLDKTIDAVTDYIARRLIEREKAMAVDDPRIAPRRAADERRPLRDYAERERYAEQDHRADDDYPRERPAEAAAAQIREAAHLTPREPAPEPVRYEQAPLAYAAEPRPARGRLWRAFLFVIELMGSVAFFGIMAFLLWYGWQYLQPLIAKAV